MIKKITLLGIIVLFTLLFIYCTTDDATILGPFGNAGKYITVTNFSADKTVLYSNGDTSFVSIRVLDVDNAPAIGLIVDFSAQFGSITESDTTDSSGIALATFISDDNTGENIITADTGVKKYELYLHVVHYQPKYVELFSASPVLMADGISTTVITAVLKDSVGNPMPEKTVIFETDRGTLSSHVEVTDEAGTAKTTLTSSTEEGVATITATSFGTKEIEVEFKNYVPEYVEIDSETYTLLADGISEVNIIAKVYDSDNAVIPGAVFDFSTTMGSLSKTTNVRANQDGEAEVTLTSAGSPIDTTIIVKAVVAVDTSIFENLNIQFRGITSITSIDSTKMSDYGTYKAFIRTNLFETSGGDNISSGVAVFSSTTGIMEPHSVAINEQGVALSVFSTDVLPTNQNHIIITSELSSAAVLTDTVELDIPGVEMLINTVDDDVMGDGEGWALVKATLREITGKAITGTKIEWSTTLGTIIGQSKTNTSGHTIDTLRIENSVNQNTAVTIYANFGDNIWINETLTFIQPVNSNRLILGFEPDIAGHGFIPCDITDSDSIGTLGIREVGVTALFVDTDSNPKPGEIITFRIVPNNLASICASSITNTAGNGNATAMLAYPLQNGGEIVRVWGTAPDGTRGSIDVILPKDAATVE